jgi:hypothetical protein
VTSFLLVSPLIFYMHSASPHSCYLTCPSDHLITLGEEYKLCSFLQPPDSSSLSGPNILLGTHVRLRRRKETLIKATVRRAEKKQDL